MAGGIAEVLKDTDPMFQGTHKGASGLTLIDQADFRSCGAMAGHAIYNVTDGSNGLIVSVTEGSVLTTLSGGVGNVWHNSDTYRIYKTATYGSTISTNYVDRRYGHKVVNQSDLVDGIKADELDVDEHERNIFGPGQPISSKRGY
jgi:hypothetical protein